MQATDSKSGSTSSSRKAITATAKRTAAQGKASAFTIGGSIPAVVTPFTSGGHIDMGRFEALVNDLIVKGSDAIVVAGTTGESATVNFEEHCALIARGVQIVVGRVPVIAGSGANSTAEAIELSLAAKRLGAQAHLSVVPYYNKPSQGGIYKHFKAIAEAVELPLILYNVPGRTVADVSNDTVLRLSKLRQIVGIKDATADIERGIDLLRRAPSGFRIYSGDDGTAVALMLLGAHGTISVTANVAPEQMAALCAAATSGNAQEAKAINDQLAELHQTLFLEPNPAPLKWMLHRLSHCSAAVRMPLTTCQPATVPFLEQALQTAGLLQAKRRGLTSKSAR